MNDRMAARYGLKAWSERRCLRSPRNFFVPLTVLFMAVSASASSADPASAPQTPPQPSYRTLALTYEVYAGGLHIFSFDVNLSLQPQGYRIVAAGSTRGITGFLYKWDVKLAAEGAQFQPMRYVTVNTGRQPTKVMQLDFNKGGSFTVTRNPPEPVEESESPEENELPSSLPVNVSDPLSAGLLATQVLARTGSCEQTIPVFDGKRRYNLLLHDAGTGEVPKGRTSVYHGPAVLCGFTMERISGFKTRRYAAQWDEDKDEPPTLWVAKVREDMPPVPVRYTGAVSLGAIVVHLTKIELGSEISSTGLP